MRVARKPVDTIYARSVIGLFWLLLSALLVVLFTSSANAQQKYKQLPFAEAYRLVEQEGAESATTRRQNKAIYSAIKNGNKAASDAIESGNPELATTFFKEYILPSMTRTNSKSLSTLGARREEFIGDFLSNKTTGAARAAFVNTVVQAMGSLAGAEDFHPAARINAVYVLGLLDSQAGDRDTAPTPASAAFSSLVQIFTGDSFPESLKVAAAAGIDRQLQLARAGNASALGGGDISKAASQALAIVNGTASGQEKWNEDLNYWLKKRSAKILGLIGQPGTDGEVVKALIKLLQLEESKQLWLAYESMSALGNIDLSTADAALTSQASVAVAQFLSRALETQAVTAQSLLDSLVYYNILLEDLDLTEKGNDYSEQPLTSFKGATNRRRAKKREPSGGGMDMDMMDMDMMDMDMMDMDMMDMDLGGAAPRARRRPGTPKVEIPTYQLNRIRSMVKALAYGGKRTLSQGPKSLQNAGGDQDKAMITDVVSELNKVIADSDVGIVDLANPPEDDDDLDEDPPGNTEQMIELCSRASSRLSAIIRANAPAGDDAVDAANGSAVSTDQPNF